MGISDKKAAGTKDVLGEMSFINVIKGDQVGALPQHLWESVFLGTIILGIQELGSNLVSTTS